MKLKRVFPDPQGLGKAYLRRRRGRPRRREWEKQELVFHRFWLLYPAARLAQESARSAGWNEFERAFWRALGDGWDWLRKMGSDRPLELFYNGSPEKIARISLSRQHGLSESTVKTYIKASDRRHRRGICLLFGLECGASGGLASMPTSPGDARWKAMLKLWQADPRLNWAGLDLEAVISTRI